jgi:hypothetical protein
MPTPEELYLIRLFLNIGLLPTSFGDKRNYWNLFKDQNLLIFFIVIILLDEARYAVPHQ